MEVISLVIDEDRGSAMKQIFLCSFLDKNWQIIIIIIIFNIFVKMTIPTIFLSLLLWKWKPTLQMSRLMTKPI